MQGWERAPDGRIQLLNQDPRVSWKFSALISYMKLVNLRM